MSTPASSRNLRAPPVRKAWSHASWRALLLAPTYAARTRSTYGKSSSGDNSSIASSSAFSSVPLGLPAACWRDDRQPRSSVFSAEGCAAREGTLSGVGFFVETCLNKEQLLDKHLISLSNLHAHH